MLKERNVRTGFFERKQIERILPHLAQAIRPAVQFAYITGWRIPSEVLKLQWRHVDFEARVVRLDPRSRSPHSQSLNFLGKIGLPTEALTHSCGPPSRFALRWATFA